MSTTVTLDTDGMPEGERRTLARLVRNAAIREAYPSLRAQGASKDDALAHIAETVELSDDAVSSVIWPRKRRVG